MVWNGKLVVWGGLGNFGVVWGVLGWFGGVSTDPGQSYYPRTPQDTPGRSAIPKRHIKYLCLFIFIITLLT